MSGFGETADSNERITFDDRFISGAVVGGKEEGRCGMEDVEAAMLEEGCALLGVTADAADRREEVFDRRGNEEG